MNTTISFQKLKDKKQIIVIHSYKNEIEILWDAFTKTGILEKWWAPEPYKAIVVSNHFENGGQLFYYMLSPTGENIIALQSFQTLSPTNPTTYLMRLLMKMPLLIRHFQE
jgi:uncharacterized protein YndB with AHSA1/START domain